MVEALRVTACSGARSSPTEHSSLRVVRGIAPDCGWAGRCRAWARRPAAGRTRRPRSRRGAAPPPAAARRAAHPRRRVDARHGALPARDAAPGARRRAAPAASSTCGPSTTPRGSAASSRSGSTASSRTTRGCSPERQRAPPRCRTARSRARRPRRGVARRPAASSSARAALQTAGSARAARRRATLVEQRQPRPRPVGEADRHRAVDRHDRNLEYVTEIIDVVPGLWVWRLDHPDYRGDDPGMGRASRLHLRRVGRRGRAARSARRRRRGGGAFTSRYRIPAYGPLLYWRHDVPAADLRPIRRGSELPGGFRCLWDGAASARRRCGCPSSAPIPCSRTAGPAHEGELR